MITPPTEITDADLRRALARHWGIDARELTYLPVGFGSHHWSATGADGRRWFLTVDDHRGGRMGEPEATSIAGLDRAFRLAGALRDRAGLAFVGAPLMTADGHAAVAIGDIPWSIAVFPHLDAEPLADGPYPPADLADGLTLVGRLHAVPVALADGLARSDDLALQRRAELDEALADLARPWGTGPYAEPVREVLAINAVELRAAIAAHDRRAARLAANCDRWVITHGEPHTRNVLRDAAGALHLIDWDTVAIGPLERDLWMLTTADGPEPDWAPYLAASGAAAVDAGAIAAYRAWWDLTDLSEYVAWFRQPHETSPEGEIGFGAIRGMFPLRPEHRR